MKEKLILENEIGNVFKNFPVFPDNVKEILVKIAPFLAMVGVLFGGLALLAVAGIGAGLSNIGALAYGSTAQYYISMAILAVMVALEAMAISPLLKRQKKGWDLMYYTQLLGLVSNLITLSIVGFILSFVIGFWILFQVRPKYN
ncbi:MAG: hypothetical protein EAZ32_14750 [Cytophagia bacterium]|jgi:hypothetical protein|nr:MAG: hypothetical protein EAZ67_11705 [Cytophagales bacterium]TAG18097.1 MAG: hypothetical protein EAZ38_15830 [Cytophagales bacterium]TAG37636.1 MAG: hypothetical protein EAZ32_14750 [Cytophagia bacterium]TAG78772.1 MAG: hypothetical protein EAZ22_12895 [Cytophagales bacterium]